MFEPLTFVSLLGKSRWCNYFSGHFAFVSEKKSFCLSRKFFSKQKQRYFRYLTKRWAFFTNLQPFELGRIFRISLPRPFFLFSMIQSFMAGFFWVLILPKEPQAFIANHRPGREFRKNKICRNFKIVVRICRKSPLL